MPGHLLTAEGSVDIYSGMTDINQGSTEQTGMCFYLVYKQMREAKNTASIVGCRECLNKVCIYNGRCAKHCENMKEERVRTGFLEKRALDLDFSVWMRF